jgi:regulator of protease activity HflC (stomatin/prohibitin superfamily)
MGVKYVKNEAERSHKMDRKFIPTIVLVVLGILVLVLFRTFSIVPAGHVMVLDVFGLVNPNELEPGLNFPVNPLAQRIEIDIRTKETKEKIVVPTREGLMAGLDVSLLFHVDPTKADELYKTVGTQFRDVIIQPMLRNVVRDVIAEFSSEDLYSQNRQKISLEIDQRLKVRYTERGITLESVLLRDVILPSEVTSAIEQKIKAKQQAEQMKYVLQKEQSEAERKKIEAQGIADAQKVISESLTPEYLQWRYITTLEGLVDSPNTTFVITPFDQKLIPMLPLEGKK